MHPSVTLAKLANTLHGCAACPVRQEASRTVPGVGPADAKVVFVGRNPGRDEDRVGQPFVGRSGDLLNEVLRSLAVDRSKIYITNTLKCFTADNRPPKAAEYHACIPKFLAVELATVNPLLVVTFGADAFKYVTGSDDSVTKSRRRWYPLASIFAKVVGIIHPSAVLREPGKRQVFESDLQWLVMQPEFVTAYSMR